MKRANPRLSLLALVSPSGLGKRTSARKHFLPKPAPAGRALTALACVLAFGIGHAPWPAKAEAASASEAGEGGFTLREFLGHSWRNELVRFPLGKVRLADAQAGRALVGPDNRPVPCQISWSEDRKEARLVFLADLDPFETRTYRFVDSSAKVQTDLRIEETPERIRLCNSLVGISIRKAIKDGAGPVEAIRTNTGQWIGASELHGNRPLRSYEAKLVAAGPAEAEVLCRLAFEGNRQWELRFRLQAAEPAVVVDEAFGLEDDSTFALHLGRGFSPQSLLHRLGKSGPEGNLGRLAAWKVEPGGAEPAFVLEPWLHWWERSRQGNWFGLYNDKGPDLVVLAALSPGVWVDPERRARQSPPRVMVRLAGDGLVAELPLRGGRRRWMIACLAKDPSLALLKDKAPQVSPPPQKCLIKHGDFPLDMVKDYILDWPGDDGSYPRLFLKKREVDLFRKSFQADPARLKALTSAPVSVHQLEDWVTYWLGTGDEALGRHLAEAAVKWTQDCVNWYLQQSATVTLGMAPHHQTLVLGAANLGDTVLGSDVLAPSLRVRLRAQLAFLGYTVNRDDYWSPSRGFSANPNMTTTVAAFGTAIACLLPSHPMAPTWGARGLAELRDSQLARWADDNGGWLEAPHYAMVSFDYLVGCFIMARNAGLADCLYDPKMRKVADWFAKISTPPDSRIMGWRHLPPIGNTYINEPTSQFAVMAYLWRDRAPTFASQMQWMHRQQGSFKSPGIGGFFPTLAGYRTILSDESIPARPPAYRSELFIRTGALLRSHFPSDRENYLHMIAGTNHDHYDKDSGSVTLWGKGRILCDDFGYYGYVTGDDHSMVVSADAPDAAIMNVTAFATTDDLDYVRGGKRSWTRQVLHVKDADPLGPNYFVLRDGLASTAPATWRLYLWARKVTPSGQSVRFEGKEDVDMDIFFARPEKVELKTEEVTRTSGSGLSPTGRQGRTTTTQIALIAGLSGGACTAALYPRLKTQAPATFASLADGKAVKVVSPAGTDYVFLNDTPFSFKDGEVSFSGSVGAAIRRGSRVILSLGAAGTVATAGHELKADGPASRRW